MDIRKDDLTGTEIAELLSQHLADMAEHSPPESVHALDLEALKRSDITFFCAWQGSELMGCGALKVHGDGLGEVKSMRTDPRFRQRGVASAILTTIIEQANQLNLSRLSLETGSMQAFKPAQILYQRFGFEECGPFASYRLDPNSIYMTKSLR
jgi:putative acetyltransferase